MTARMNPYVKHSSAGEAADRSRRHRSGLWAGEEAHGTRKIRASQINGCGVCLDMHSKEARKEGETEERILMLSAWRETTLYNEREKAALAWTEALTRLPEKGAPDDVYEAVQAMFNEEEQVALTLLVGVINSFNRIGVGFHVPPSRSSSARLPDGGHRQAPDAAASLRSAASETRRGSPIACWVRSPTPRMSCRTPSCAGWRPTVRPCGSPKAFLRRTVTRLCLDQLKSARRRREVYPGEWLPEPVVETEEDEIDDVTLPLMMALERLSPLERAAFILHDVFGVGFEEVAETLGRDAAATRQLAARARSHVREDRPRFDLPKEAGLEIAEAFFTPRAAAT